MSHLRKVFHLIWMFCGKTANEEVNRVHKRALRELLHDFDYALEELLHRNEEVTIHVKNLQKLMLEVYKCISSGNPSFLWEFFNRKMLPYSLRINDLLQLPKPGLVDMETSLFHFRVAWFGIGFQTNIKLQKAVMSSK